MLWPDVRKLFIFWHVEERRLAGRQRYAADRGWAGDCELSLWTIEDIVRPQLRRRHMNVTPLLVRVADWLSGTIGNPTKDWGRGIAPKMEYRLSSRALGGMRLGTALVNLRSLGRCEVVHRSGGYADLVYRRYGLIVALDKDDSLLSVEAVLAPGSVTGERFRMNFTRLSLENLSGSSLVVSSVCPPQEVTAFLGEPIDQFVSVGQLITQYVVAGSSFDFTHTKDGTALAVEIGAAA